jgi:ASC-1-like (ASCH) protein
MSLTRGSPTDPLTVALPLDVVSPCVACSLDAHTVSKWMEGRPNTTWVSGCEPNDAIRFNITGGGPKLCVRVRSVTRFDKGEDAWRRLVRYCGVTVLLPDLAADDEDFAVATYRKFGTTEGTYYDLERSVGVAAIHIEPI